MRINDNKKIIIPGVGNWNSKILFIGEAGGFNEHLQKKPFVGKSGKLLDMIFDKLNLFRKQIFITNIVKFRPINNKCQNIKPLLSDIREQSIILFNEIKMLTKLRVIITLGSVAINSLLKFVFMINSADIIISKYRGQIIKYRNFLIIPTFHPAYILRNNKKFNLLFNDIKLGVINI